MKNDYIGIYDYKESDTLRPTMAKRIHKGSKTSKCICTRADSCCVIERERKMLKIRKLTPLECCRLMGADDSVDEKLKKAGLSDSQRYHIYGDALVVNIPQKIFERMK